MFLRCAIEKTERPFSKRAGGLGTTSAAHNMDERKTKGRRDGGTGNAEPNYNTLPEALEQMAHIKDIEKRMKDVQSKLVRSCACVGFSSRRHARPRRSPPLGHAHTTWARDARVGGLVGAAVWARALFFLLPRRPVRVWAPSTLPRRITTLLCLVVGRAPHQRVASRL